MLKKKALVFTYSILFTSILFITLWLLSGRFNELITDKLIIESIVVFILNIGIYFPILVFPFIIFGVPVNLASTFISKRINNRNIQTLVHLLIHLTAGYMIGEFIFHYAGIIVAFCASIVFVFDQWIVFKHNSLKLIAVPLLFVFAAISISYITWFKNGLVNKGCLRFIYNLLGNL